MRRLLLLRHTGLLHQRRCLRMSRRNRGDVRSRRMSRRNRGDLSKRLPSPRQSADLSERLPLEHIMKYLPLRQRVQALCVCKAWNHILRGCKCYCKESFCDLDMPRLASSGGLMCALLTADVGHVNGNVVVFNCLTGSVETIPPPLRSDLLFWGRDLYSDTLYSGPFPCFTYMAVDDLDHYIMLTNVRECCNQYFSEDDMHMEVFDSKIWGWKDATIPNYVPVHTYVWDADFFFIYEHYRGFFYLSAYSVAHDVWSIEQLPVDCSQYIDNDETLFIHKFEGRIFLAIHHLSKPHGFCIWEVRQSPLGDAMWVEVASTPPQISSDIKNRTKDCDVGCGLQAAGSCFYFLTYVDGFSEIPPLVWDIGSNSWYFLSMKEWCSNWDFVLVHQPSLSAHV